VNMTRNGAPFHGATGDGRTAISAASSQVPDELCARESATGKRKAEKAPAISRNAGVVAEKWRVGNN